MVGTVRPVLDLSESWGLTPTGSLVVHALRLVIDCKVWSGGRTGAQPRLKS